MRKILKYRWYVFFFIFFVEILSVGAEEGAVPPPSGLEIPPPDGLTCCKDLEPEDGEPPSAEYMDCIEHPEKYCPIPIDNSVYVLMGAGLVLASFVIFRKIRHKKTPM